MTRDPRDEASLAVTELRRNWLLLAVLAAVGWIGLYGILSEEIAGVVFGWLGVGWSVIICGTAFARGSFPRRYPRMLRATPDGLEIDAMLLRRADILSAYVEPGPGYAVLRLRERSGRRWAFALPGARTGHAILDAIELGPERRCAVFRALSPLASMAATKFAPAPLFAIGGALGALITSIVVASPLPFLALFAAAVLWKLPKRVVVGADGIRISWCGFRRFVPYDEVANVDFETRHHTFVNIELRNGARLLLAGRKNDDREAIRGSDDLALADRVRLAVQAYKVNAHREDPTPLLARGGRALADWVREVGALGSARAAGYRQATLDRDRICRILQDASAAASTRVGAAIALVAGDGGERGVLKEVAAGCANPRIRVALEAVVASPRERDWDEALEALEDDAPAPMRATMTER